MGKFYTQGLKNSYSQIKDTTFCCHEHFEKLLLLPWGGGGGGGGGDTVATTAYINPLKTKRRLLYLKTQFVPRSKHFSSRL